MNKIMPTALAFLIADLIIDDIVTRKKSIIGLFNSICSNKFPFRHREMNIFVSLTDGHGKYDTSLVCTRASDEKTIFKSSGIVDLQSPNTVVEINFALRNMEFPTHGKYIFQFYCGNKLLVMRPFDVLNVEKSNSNSKYLDQ